MQKTLVLKVCHSQTSSVQHRLLASESWRATVCLCNCCYVISTGTANTVSSSIASAAAVHAGELACNSFSKMCVCIKALHAAKAQCKHTHLPNPAQPCNSLLHKDACSSKAQVNLHASRSCVCAAITCSDSTDRAHSLSSKGSIET